MPELQSAPPESIPGFAAQLAATSRRSLPYLVGLFSISLSFSIAAAQILLTLVCIAWLAGGDRWAWSPPLKWAFIFSALTLLSATFSDDPWTSLLDAKELLQFAILAVVPTIVERRPGLARRLIDCLLVAGTASSGVGLVLYFESFGGLLNRSRGPFGHYMTFAGVLMLIATAALGILLTRREEGRYWAMLAAPILLAALAVTYARNAWLGLAAAATTLAAIRRRAALPVLALGAIAMVLLAPPELRQRLFSAFRLDLNEDRVEMIDVARNIISQHPLLGVGASRVAEVYPTFGGSRPQPHLHNNVLQLAAERGLPALAAWLAMIIALFRSAWRAMARCPSDPVPACSVAAIVALLVAGLFEYNFGDSEVKMTFLLLVALSTSTGDRDKVDQRPPTV